MIIKVCGLREIENIRQVESLDIDCMGFVFYPQSPRCVPLDNEHEEVIRRCRRKKSGVFVNDTVDNMAAIAERLQLYFVQLHGAESVEMCVAMQRRGFAVSKAFPIASEDDLKRVKPYIGCVDYFLFDTKCVEYGGSGKRFDWSILKAYKENVPFMLSGGISPESLEDIKNLRHPQFSGIDLNSGFETAPGIKDVAKLREFVREIRNI